MTVIFTDRDRSVTFDEEGRPTVPKWTCKVLKVDGQCFFTNVDGLCILAGDVTIDGKKVTPLCREREIG